MTNMDLSTESIDIKSNEYLCRRLTNQSGELFTQIQNMSNILDLVVKLLMSRYRLESSYPEHSDSLLQMATNKHGLSSSSQSIESFKFCIIVRDFGKYVLRDLVAYLTSMVINNRHDFDSNSFESLILPIVFLIEKLYMICSACPYDNLMSIPYAKYYWNLICERIAHSDIQK